MNLSHLAICLEHNIYHVRQVAAFLFIAKHKHKKVDFKDVALSLKLRPSATSRVVSALVKLHLVGRERPHNDHRRAHLFLTEEGHKLAARLLV